MASKAKRTCIVVQQKTEDVQPLGSPVVKLLRVASVLGMSFLCPSESFD